jgi:hypothetical protein
VILEQPDIQGIIAIDCWEEDFLKDYYKNLNNKIDFDKIQSLIVANYEVKLDIQDTSVYNTLETYAWHNFNQDMLLPLLKETRLRETSSWLKTKMKAHSFMLLDMFSVDYHIKNVVPHIDNWLVIGGSWQQCTHGRPVCFDELKKLNKNFYISTWSIFDACKENCKLSNNDILADKITWTPVGEYFLL